MLRPIATNSALRTMAVVARTYASMAAPAAIELTELSNGLAVAASHTPHANHNSISLTFNTGSSVESRYNSGVSNVWSHYFKSRDVAALAAREGFTLDSRVNKESQTFTLSSANPNNAPKMLAFFQKNLVDEFNTGANLGKKFDAVRATAALEAENLDINNHDAYLLEHLHATAFQNTPLALPTRGSQESIESLEAGDLMKFAKDNYHSRNATVVSTGNITPDAVMKAIEGNLSLTTTPTTESVTRATSSFLGSEIRLRDDTLPKAWVSIAVESEPINSPDYLVAKLASHIYGSYDAHEPRSRMQGIKLVDKVQDYQLCDSFRHFNFSYRDSGLWGFMTEISDPSNVDEMVHFTLKQWNRLSVSVTETELQRAKAMLKLELGILFDQLAADSAKLADKVVSGDTTFYLNNSANLDQLFAQVDALTVKDLKRWANKRVWDQDIAVAGHGQIEDLLDYMRMRNDMSMMRW